MNLSRREQPRADQNILMDVTTAFTEISGLPARLDGLVYAPGSIHLKPFQSLKPEDFLRDMEVNLLGAVKVVKASLKSLKASENASVVFFSTIAVSQGMPYHASVAAAKGAVEGLTRSLAAEYVRAGIRFNAIAPSLTDTPLAGVLLASEEKRKASAERHPLGRTGTPQEVAAAAIYLLSDSASWVTGQIWHLDGGLSAVRTL